MSMKYASFILEQVRKYVLSRSTLLWGFAFSLFWSFIGAFSGLPEDLKQNLARIDTLGLGNYWLGQGYLLYGSVWYMFVFSAVLGSVSASISMSYSHRLPSIRFLMKYGRLTPISFLATSVVSGVVASSIVGLSLGLTLSLLLSENGLGALIYPHDIPLLIFSMALSGVFVMSLTVLLNTLFMRWEDIQRILPFSLLMVSIGTFFLWEYGNFSTSLPDYINPFSSLMIMSGSAFYGSGLPAWDSRITYSSSPPYLGTSSFSPINLGYVELSSLVWTLVVLVLSILAVNSSFVREHIEFQSGE